MASFIVSTPDKVLCDSQMVSLGLYVRIDDLVVEKLVCFAARLQSANRHSWMRRRRKGELRMLCPRLKSQRSLRVAG